MAFSKSVVVTCEEGKQEDREGFLGVWGSRWVVTVEEKQTLVNAATPELSCIHFRLSMARSLINIIYCSLTL